jgi:hypothetical protein
MVVELITKEDLDNFKKELIDEIRVLLGEKPKDQEYMWLTGKETREILRVSPGTLAMYTRKGALGVSKIYGKNFYKREEVLKFIENGRNS